MRLDKIEELRVARLIRQWTVTECVVANLIREPGTRAIWIEDSLASGTADVYSDVDLRVSVAAPFMPGVWQHRHRIADIPQGLVLDLDHQWGAPPVLSFAALYQTGVYLDLTLAEARSGPMSDGILLWSNP